VTTTRTTAEIAIWFLLLCGGSWADDALPVAPDLPVAAIDVADVSGRPVTGAAELSKLLVITSEKAVHGDAVGSLLWIVDTFPPTVIESTVRDNGSTLIVSTGTTQTTLAITQIAALGNRAAYQRLLVKIGHGYIPPPEPDDDDVEPKPTPGPTAPKVSLSVLFDPVNVTPDTAIVLNSRDSWKAIPGVVWPRVDFSTGSSEARAIELKSLVQSKGVPVPALVIDDAATKANIGVIPLPESVELLKTAVGGFVKP
jgi:hypothetical protein